MKAPAADKNIFHTAVKRYIRRWVVCMVSGCAAKGRGRNKGEGETGLWK